VNNLTIDGIHQVFCLPGGITWPSSKSSFATPRSLQVSIDITLVFSSLADLRSPATLNVARFYGIRPKPCIRFTRMGVFKRGQPRKRAMSSFGATAEKL
jgi:hypothetical protein